MNLWLARAGLAVAAAAPAQEWVVFGTGTPAFLDEADPGIALSTGFRINDATTYYCRGVQFYASANAPPAVEVALWQRLDDATPGAQLAVKSQVGGVTPGIRNRVLFAASVPVSAALYATGLYATCFTTRYTATGGYFTAGGETSGPITAYADGAGFGRNGRFATPVAAAAYPTGEFNGGGYWVSPIISDQP